jgi:superfamily II DNA or RNA helicase
MNALIPIHGAWVCRVGSADKIGVVVSVVDGPADPSIDVDFGPHGRERLRMGEWSNGLRPGFVVQDVPLSGVRTTLGVGKVLRTRTLAGCEQALVQFSLSGQLRWLPFEQLRRIKDAEIMYQRAELLDKNASERTALNIIAHALRTWNEATGALDRLDVDPLPHQIGLVHRILSSGQSNWLIADDVGLGKTIEVGLLLSALERRQNVRRILIVVPSSLTKQWKEEMLVKFDRIFSIFGVDFQVNDPREWGLYQRVIVSLDYAKPRTSEDDGIETTTRFGMLLAAGTWDIVIFDEAHRLSRDERGRSTLRFKLAQGLRRNTDALLLLTGTPHQGDVGKFRNLLAIVRPDLAHAINTLDSAPDVVNEIVLRNRKIDAVDAEGKFIFRGLVVRRVEIARDEDMLALESELASYFRRGYRAGDALGGSVGRAIGFVMTIYRKLASSSVAALGVALGGRLDRLRSASAQGPADVVPQNRFTEEQLEPEDDFEGDDQIELRSVENVATPFFDDEIATLSALIEKCVQRLRHDKKLERLVEIIGKVVVERKRKVVIFTEFRATQAYLAIKLKELLGIESAMINGGLDVDEKRAAVNAFETERDILISTEAGGEGLNLHRRCHILINYDIPWNPARITQRIGRLYRYGQAERVIVMNFHSRDTIDNEIMSGLFDRLDVIVTQMAPVGSEFNDRYAAEIMGELLERVDISALLEEARNGTVERTKERIDAALELARKAKTIQDEILASATGFGVGTWQTLGAFETSHVASFIRRSAPLVGVSVSPSALDSEKFELRLPQSMRGVFPEFGSRTVVAATTRRGSWRSGGEQVLLDFSASFLKHLVELVTAPEFGGSYGAFIPDTLGFSFLAAFMARFQNDQGEMQGQALMVVVRDSEGKYIVDNRKIEPMLSAPLVDAAPQPTKSSSRKIETDAARDRAEVAMASEISRFRHPNDLFLLAALEGIAV